MPTNKRPLLGLVATDELIARIDDFRFANRFRTRSAATLKLIALGFEFLKEHPDYLEGDNDVQK